MVFWGRHVAVEWRRIKGLFLRLLFFQRGRRNCANSLKVKTEQVVRVLRVFLIVAHQCGFSFFSSNQRKRAQLYGVLWIDGSGKPRDDDGAFCLGSIGNPNRDVVVSQLSSLNQLFESFKSFKTKPSMLTISQGDAEFPPMGGFQIEGLSPAKWPKSVSWNTRGLGSRKKRRVVKDFLRLENLDVVMFQETKRGPLWLSAVYGQTIPYLEGFLGGAIRHFWPFFSFMVCGGDFNVIRRSSEKLGGSSFTSSMRDFDGFIRDCELLDPPYGMPLSLGQTCKSYRCARDWIGFFIQMSGSYYSSKPSRSSS
ncbi:hypothetical protein CK203_056566 [Vitis vinifera]|uniref:Endonuclease/exonuclease/phosphatase domain-containing protein n=1 Tax=Vitis vinifera TaxID=29760 RepID=A0A438GKD7_VITVI|nr:hypothetical protein CK203_056566 [Vitis vinifera]